MSLSVAVEKQLGSFRLAVSFESGGGLLGLLGASGSGKSMTLMCIAGIVRPDSGRIVLDGVTLFDSDLGINLPPQKRRVGYLFQNYALFPHMTVRRNILCGLRGEAKKSEADGAVREMLALTRLDGLENRKPAQLSGGQQQRAALARILVGKPNLILLDEPFSALDSHLRDALGTETKALLRRYGKGVVMVTHDRAEAYRMCESVALLDGGRVIDHRETAALFADPQSRAAARLTGVANIAGAVRTGEHGLFVPGWGVALRTSRTLREGLTAVGIHDRSFSPEVAQNRFPIQITEERPEPFESAFLFRYGGQSAGEAAVVWRAPRKRGGGTLPAELGVAPEDILPLYDTPTA